MDISNDTPLDAKYKVSGGGVPVGPHGRFVPSEDTSTWPVIAANSVVSLSVTQKGPWRVYFVVNDEGFVVDARADNDFVHLSPSGGSFRAEVRRMAHATHT